MTIAFDAATTKTASVADPSWTHTVGSSKDRFLVVYTNVRRDTGYGAPSMNSVSLGAQTLTELASGNSPNNTFYQWTHYMVAPPQGAGTITVDGSWAAGQNIACGAVTYVGVDQSNPIVESTNTIADKRLSPSATVASSTNALVIDCSGSVYSSTSAFTAGALQTVRATTVIGTGGSQSGFALSEEAGANSVTMSWTVAQGGVDSDYGEGHMVISLNPSVDLFGRVIKYFHDINDPDGRIFDDLGRVVPPWELRANNWIRVGGLFLPSSTKYTSFTQDPELAYIEEVSFSARGGLRIKTSRGELTEVLLARAAGGKTL